MGPFDSVPTGSLMTTVVQVAATSGPDKLVEMPYLSDSVAMGMHDELAEFYGAVAGSFQPRASTLDYLVAATAACLTGTLKRAIAARGVELAPECIRATGRGTIVVDRDTPVLRRIEVAYRIAEVAVDDRAKVERAHEVHPRGCAASRSIRAAIAIETQLTFD